MREATLAATSQEMGSLMGRRSRSAPHVFRRYHLDDVAEDEPQDSQDGGGDEHVRDPVVPDLGGEQEEGHGPIVDVRSARVLPAPWPRSRFGRPPAYAI